MQKFIRISAIAAAALAASSVITPLIRLCTGSANFGQCLSYAVCGMRIVSKLTHKQQSV